MDLDFRVIWSDAETNKTVRNRKRFIEVDMRVRELGEDPVRGVEACGTAANNGDAEGSLSLAGLF